LICGSLRDQQKRKYRKTDISNLSIFPTGLWIWRKQLATGIALCHLHHHSADKQGEQNARTAPIHAVPTKQENADHDLNDGKNNETGFATGLNAETLHGLSTQLAISHPANTKTPNKNRHQ
jgi:hypothetical protein